MVLRTAAAGSPAPRAPAATRADISCSSRVFRCPQAVEEAHGGGVLLQGLGPLRLGRQRRPESERVRAHPGDVAREHEVVEGGVLLRQDGCAVARPEAESGGDSRALLEQVGQVLDSFLPGHGLLPHDG